MKRILKKQTYKLPVVVVRDIVVFPNTIVPIFVGRPKSINSLQRALEYDSDVLVLSQKDDDIGDEIDITKLPNIGTVCKIAQAMKLPDGTMKVVFDCICRATTAKITDNDYIEAEIEMPKQTKEQNNTNIEALTQNVRSVFSKSLSFSNDKSNQDIYESILSINDPEAMCDVLASRADFSNDFKIDLLQTINLEDRMEKIVNAITDKNNLNALQRELKRKTDRHIDKNNREYYLQEQMRLIKKELGDSENPMDVSDKYEKKIEEKHLPQKVADKVREEIKRLKYLGAMSSEAGVIRGYLDTIFDLPWVEKSELKTDIKGAEKYLNESHYGMEKAKERILESIAVQIKTGEQPKKTILCLYGAPGVGKTSLAEAMAKATGREFVKIALGGVGDEAEIRGHRKTYLGSMPGKIIMAMKQAKTVNPLILLDEIDKLSSDSRGDPASALLEVLDYQQNNKFVDHYLEVEYDLSQVMFVATANSLKIAHALLDRLEVIKVPSYLEQEKFHIAKNFIIPRQLKENGLTKEECKIKDSAIIDIIKYYTREAGVRDLERKIGKLCRKAVIETLRTKKIVEIGSKNLKDYLGVKKYEHTVIERKDFVGVVNGLAYTEVGGDILMIEAVKLPNGKGEIKYTGDLGNVMKESIQTAFSLVKSKAKDFGIDPDVFKKHDIHIHVPDGATPKDGPSAGITMVTAIVSLLTGKTVSKYLAMTGEISLRGAVLPIGGLREKLTSAVRSGVKEVIIPKDNEKDLEEVPADVVKKLNIHPCDRIEQVMNVVFNSNADAKDKTEQHKDIIIKAKSVKSAKSDGKKNITHPNSKIDKERVVI